MKTYALKLIPLVFLLLIISACKKKEDSPSGFTHRIISEKWYNNNILGGETTYEYTGNKLSSVNTVEGTYNSQNAITYPSENSIIITYTSTDGGNGTTYATLTNNLITEVIDGDYKTTLSYNSDGNIENMKDYNLVGTWIQSGEITYTYSSGKLVQVLEVYNEGQGNYQDKYTITYNGEAITDQTHTYLYPGGSWTDCHKNVYTLTSGKISKIAYSYKDVSSWIESGSEDFEYDDAGNLISLTSAGVESNYRVEYTYEEVSGNYRLFGGFFDYDYMYPMPNKTSRSPERNFNILKQLSHGCPLVKTGL